LWDEGELLRGSGKVAGDERENYFKSKKSTLNKT
jgi:hypothetical protein